ncbi:hypothetical protein BKA70DRAFT_10788 [Coprinopsis sp. MPI-PUGE-AT-0042]|nr:hypothetical protein BKA70DRAFT_10788 [Coprinopsis sp. MPI-PUGE-AT-0042]
MAVRRRPTPGAWKNHCAFDPPDATSNVFCPLTMSQSFPNEILSRILDAVVEVTALYDKTTVKFLKNAALTLGFVRHLKLFLNLLSRVSNTLEDLTVRYHGSLDLSFFKIHQSNHGSAALLAWSGFTFNLRTFTARMQSAQFCISISTGEFRSPIIRLLR